MNSSSFPLDHGAQPSAAQRNNSSSLRRALAILREVGADDVPSTGLTLGEISARSGIHRNTVLRLISPLCEERLVERSSAGYRLGSEVARLGGRYLDDLDLRDVSHDSLVRLTAVCGETVHLVIFDAPEVVYIDKVDPPKAVRMYSRVGSRQPAYCTGVGKAFLAYGTEADLRAVIEAGLAARTPNTITTEAKLRQELLAIRARGYSVDDVENEPDIRCVGCCIFDRSDRPAAAISVSGPATRVTANIVEHLGEFVRATAAELSTRLGGRLRPPEESLH